MPKLTGDEGAIGAVFAIALACGLLIGVIGLAVDAGTMMVASRRVQNAADTVAETVAMHCARDVASSSCLTDSYSTVGFNSASVTNAGLLGSIANSAGGSAVRVVKVCGKTTTAMGVPACSALTARNYDCKTNLVGSASYASWIRVYTQSSAAITPVFMSLLNPAAASATPTACSQVYWGFVNKVQWQPSGSQLPILPTVCDVDASKFDTVVVLKDTKTDTGATCSLRDWNQVAYTSTTHGFTVIDSASASAACAALPAPTGSAACARTYATDVPFNTNAISGANPVNDYTTLVSAMRLAVGKQFVLPVVEKSGTALGVRSFAQFRLLGFRFPTKGTGARAVTTANSFAFASASYTASLNSLCGSTSSGTSVPCIIGTFSPSVISGYNQPANAAPQLGVSYPNLGYQMVAHIN